MACGLANRMFQYSYYLYLKKVGYNVEIDFYRTAKLKHEHVSWRTIFPNASIHQASAWEVFKTGGGSSLLAKIRRRYLPFSCKVKQMTTAFDVSLPKKSETLLYVIGVFQNVQIINYVQQEILEAFTFQPFMDEYNLALKRNVESCQSVAIHVRKGKDYQSSIWFQHTCPLEYYQRAIRLIKEKVDNPRFYVFADNKEWVKENFKDFEYTLVDGNPVAGYGSHFDMQLMSLCRHQILSNSTYSWWSAFLNKNQEKTVVCPEIWFNPDSCEEYTSRQVLCKGWIAL